MFSITPCRQQLNCEIQHDPCGIQMETIRSDTLAAHAEAQLATRYVVTPQHTIRAGLLSIQRRRRLWGEPRYRSLAKNPLIGTPRRERLDAHAESACLAGEFWKLYEPLAGQCTSKKAR